MRYVRTKRNAIYVRNIIWFEDWYCNVSNKGDSCKKIGCQNCLDTCTVVCKNCSTLAAMRKTPGMSAIIKYRDEGHIHHSGTIDLC